jgi:hypothetical protein
MVDLAFTRPHPFPDKSLYLRWRIRGGKVGPAIFAAIDVALLEFRFRLTPVPGVHVHNQDGVRVAPTGFSDSENPQHREYVPRRPLVLSIIKKRIFWKAAGIELLEIICAGGAIILRSGF